MMRHLLGISDFLTVTTSFSDHRFRRMTFVQQCSCKSTDHDENITTHININVSTRSGQLPKFQHFKFGTFTVYWSLNANAAWQSITVYWSRHSSVLFLRNRPPTLVCIVWLSTLSSRMTLLILNLNSKVAPNCQIRPIPATGTLI